MPQFVIEREMPRVGRLGTADLKGSPQTSCSVLRELGPDIQCFHSYVTDDKIYCIYRAPNDEIIRRHAEAGGLLPTAFPKCEPSLIRPPQTRPRESGG